MSYWISHLAQAVSTSMNWTQFNWVSNDITLIRRDYREISIKQLNAGG